MKNQNRILPDGTILPDGYELIHGEIHTPSGQVLAIPYNKYGFPSYFDNIIPPNTDSMIIEITNEMKPLFSLSEITRNYEDAHKATYNYRFDLHKSKCSNLEESVFIDNEIELLITLINQTKASGLNDPENPVLNKAKAYLKWLEAESKKNNQGKTSVSKQEQTFLSLWKDKSHADEVKQIFETHCYTKDGKWDGLSKNKSELLAAYYVLKPLLNPGKDTPQAKIFYQEFGLSDDYISDRFLRCEPFNADRDEFERIFISILPK